MTKTLEEIGNSKHKGIEVEMNSAVWLEILLQVVRKCLPWGLPWSPKPFTSFPHPNWPGIGGEGLVKTETLGFASQLGHLPHHFLQDLPKLLLLL